MASVCYEPSPRRSGSSGVVCVVRRWSLAVAVVVAIVLVEGAEGKGEGSPPWQGPKGSPQKE